MTREEKKVSTETRQKLGEIIKKRKREKNGRLMSEMRSIEGGV